MARGTAPAVPGLRLRRAGGDGGHHTLPVRRLAGLPAGPAPKRDAGRPRGHTQAPRRLAGSAAPKPGTRRHLSHDGSPKAPVRSAPPSSRRRPAPLTVAPRRPASPPAAPRSGWVPAPGSGDLRRAVRLRTRSRGRLDQLGHRRGHGVGVRDAHQPGAAGERRVRRSTAGRGRPSRPRPRRCAGRRPGSGTRQVPALVTRVRATWPLEPARSPSSARSSSVAGQYRARACATPHLSRTKCGNRGGGCCAWRLTRDQTNSLATSAIGTNRRRPSSVSGRNPYRA